MGLSGSLDVGDGKVVSVKMTLRFFTLVIRGGHCLNRKYRQKSEFGEDNEFMLDILNLTFLHGLSKQ